MTEQFNGQVFVYGSLRSGFHHPAYAYISRYFTLVAEAKVKGSLYDMGEYPAAIPSEKDLFIIGELYRINSPDEFAWAIAQLDDYEGVHTENNEPSLYRREQTVVYTKDGETQAWVYWFNRDTSGKPAIESGDVLHYLQQKNKS
ncbi:MAG: gamma-glutamylcyclotransferase family protein [Sediminibacterium sp.]